MAKYDKGILGPFRGMVGSVVGALFRGKPIMKSKGPSTRKNSAPKQLIQQAKFKMTSKLIRGFKKLFETTYAVNAQGRTPRNIALGQIIQDAFTGVYPDLQIDYAKVMISQGSLEKPIAATATLPDGENMIWRWDPDSAKDGSNPEDLAIVAVYCPEYNNTHFLLSGPKRSEASSTMEVTTFAGKIVHTYMAFISPDGLKISDSVYTGQFNVPIV